MVFDHFWKELYMKDIRYDGKLDFRIDNIGYVKVMRDENFTVPYRSGKEKYSIIIPESGSMSYFFPDTDDTILLYPGDIIFIPCRCPYVATYLRKDTVMNLLNFNVFGTLFPDNERVPVKRTLPELSQSLTAVLAKNSFNTVYLASKIYEILALFDTHPTETDKKYRRIIPAIEALQERYYENEKLSYYAEMCGMSESTFRKLFREYMGRSPIEYRNTVRISQVRRMLDSCEYTVTEAAYAAGFNNMSFFYEVLGKHGGK